MRWPWVGVGRLGDAHEERDYLRAELAAAQDHIRRMQRRAEGLPETPKKEAPAIVVPDDLSRAAWSNPDIGKRMEDRAVALFKILNDWDRVRDKLRPSGDDADA